jgi:glycosyltransferase involved in cell wall biosynthesis
MAVISSLLSCQVRELMPNLSLVVCLYHERELLARLLEQVSDLVDDIVVVHDGSEEEDGPTNENNKPPALDYSSLIGRTSGDEAYIPGGYPPKRGSIGEMVQERDGRFFTGPRCFQQEPHWPFAWSVARNNWILRLDADEYPGEDLKNWLRGFRDAKELSSETVSGYTCIWPLWDGKHEVTQRWPAGRIFLIHRERVRFFGMVEQVPLADTYFKSVDSVLHHRPSRKSFGLTNLLFRRQAYNWRRVIAKSLLTSPTNLPRWRWSSRDWPEQWTQIRKQPLSTGMRRLVRAPVHQAIEMWRVEKRVDLSAVLGTGMHQFLLCCWFMVYKQAFRRRCSKDEY